MIIKICGLREPGNLRAVAALEPDYMGLIFYEKSARFVGHALPPAALRRLPSAVQTVGVFVNAEPADVLATARRYHLAYAQLHGAETPEYCRDLHRHGLRLIKAFGVGAGFDFTAVANYAPYCDFFLFDTAGPLPGGNGAAFDWEVLRGYHGATPFFLSGGLGLDNLEALQRFEHPQLYGADFNSRLETAPGVKNVAAVARVLEELRTPAASL